MEEVMWQSLKKARKEAVEKAEKEGLNSKFEKYFEAGFEEGFKEGGELQKQDEILEEMIIEAIARAYYKYGQTVDQICELVKSFMPKKSDDYIRTFVEKVVEKNKYKKY